MITWLAFLLDEIFFHAYHQQKVDSPVFIIGNFRSGSTLLQRLMVKNDEHLTAMRTWEIYLAPSITQRKFWKLAARLDRKLFEGRIRRKLDQIEAKSLNKIPMHRVGLHEVDEDEGVLLHNWTSAFLMFVFPFMEALPPYLNFDSDNSLNDKRMAMDFYYRMVQKHVYYHGGKRYIAKNPAFSSKIKALSSYFPDAKYIYLVRNPVDMLASKTSYFAFCWRFFNDPLEPYPFKDLLLDLTKRWYVDTLKALDGLPKSNYVILKYGDLVGELDTSTRLLFNHFDIPLTEKFEGKLAEAVAAASGYKSKHKYSLHELGYTAEQVYDHYREIFDRFEFDLNGKALMAKVSQQYAEID